MNNIDLKELVRQAIKSEWEAFEREHPRLAAALDQTLLIEQAAESLADDAEYQSTLSRAAAAGLAADTLYDTVARFVRDWMRRLI